MGLPRFMRSSPISRSAQKQLEHDMLMEMTDGKGKTEIHVGCAEAEATARRILRELKHIKQVVNPITADVTHMRNLMVDIGDQVLELYEYFRQAEYFQEKDRREREENEE